MKCTFTSDTSDLSERLTCVLKKQYTFTGPSRGTFSRCVLARVDALKTTRGTQPHGFGDSSNTNVRVSFANALATVCRVCFYSVRCTVEFP